MDKQIRRGEKLATTAVASGCVPAIFSEHAMAFGYEGRRHSRAFVPRGSGPNGARMLLAGPASPQPLHRKEA